MFGLTGWEMLALGVVVVIGIALYARRNSGAQAALMGVLPTSGQAALLSLENHLYTKRDILAQTESAVAAVKGKIIAEAKATLEKEGYTVTKA